jgi:phage shock protein A
MTTTTNLETEVALLKNEVEDLKDEICNVRMESMMMILSACVVSMGSDMSSEARSTIGGALKQIKAKFDHFGKQYDAKKEARNKAREEMLKKAIDNAWKEAWDEVTAT